MTPNFEKVSLEEALGTKPEPATTTVLPSKEYHVVDPESGAVVGTIDAPLSFCPLIGCDAAKGMKHPMSFIQPLQDGRELWVHRYCLRPTLVWWSGHWDRLVLPREGAELPWK